MWCWRRLLRVLWTARRWNQSILKEINPEDSLEGLMVKLKLQYLGYLTPRADSLEQTLMLGKTEGKRRRGQQRMWWLENITNSTNLSFEQTPVGSEGQGSLACCSLWGGSQTQLSNTRYVQAQLPSSAVGYSFVSAPRFCCLGTALFPEVFTPQSKCIRVRKQEQDKS